jgi:hypothetical protein
VRDGSYYSSDTKNPLGYLPRMRNVAPAITETSLTAIEHAMAVPATVTTEPDDVDLDEITLRIRDSQATKTDQRTVRFNERANSGGDQREVNNVLLEPERFNRYSSQYRLRVTFKGVSVPIGGSYEVVAGDVTGLRTVMSSNAASQMYVTLFRWADNLPPGRAIKYESEQNRGRAMR